MLCSTNIVRRNMGGFWHSSSIPEVSGSSAQFFSLKVGSSHDILLGLSLQRSLPAPCSSATGCL